jgi:sugar-specific transcriptional regulator TrmB
MPTENEIENARRDTLVKKEYEGYEKQKQKERKENEAPRRAVSEAFSAVKSKASELVGKAKKSMGMKSGGSVKSASARADGIAQRGKTKGRIC